MLNLEEIKNSIENNYYRVLEDENYGEYFLSIFNENEKIIIHLYDSTGSASWAIEKEEFLKIESKEDLEKLINQVLYYNWID